MMLFLGALAASLLTAVGAADSRPPQARRTNSSEVKGKEGGSSAVLLLNQAASLIRYARDQESAVAMIAAAQMLRRLRLDEDEARFGTVKSEGAAEGDVESAPDGATTLDPAALLAEAKPWATGNPLLRELIDVEMKKPASSASGTLGAVGGAKYHVKRIRSGEIQTFTLDFRAGEVAAVSIDGNGKSDLDVYVFDENGRPVGRDVGKSDVCRVVWTPQWTGTFSVKLKNEGRSKNTYRIATN